MICHSEVLDPDLHMSPVTSNCFEELGSFLVPMLSFVTFFSITLLCRNEYITVNYRVIYKDKITPLKVTFSCT